MAEQLYRIHGRAMTNGNTWAGTGLFPEAEARRYAEEMTREQSTLPPSQGPCEFWIEPARPDTGERMPR